MTHEAYYTDTGDIAWRIIPGELKFEPRKHDDAALPTLNRAARRTLTKHIKHKIALQLRHALAHQSKQVKKAEKTAHEQA